MRDSFLEHGVQYYTQEMSSSAETDFRSFERFSFVKSATLMWPCGHLIAVPNVTAHPSMASVPTSYY